ncbi:MAG: 50S ribosomal protein L22 [Patescibacteria group bacterium]|nr:50S ribosomal protein L22 [Patescibacteria group bacterium]
MTLVKAKLSNYRQSPRKVRLVADLVRGKKVEKALQELSFVNKKATRVVKKLLESAVANAKNNKGLDKKDLILKEIRVDNATTLKRFRAGARGQAYPLKRRVSHISIAVEDVASDIKKEVKSVKSVDKDIKLKKPKLKK